MVAFGDSLSDTGNAAAILGFTLEPPYPAVPIAPYAISDGRFSDGKVWLERLAKRIDAKKGAKASTSNPGRHTNYAVGGARARDSGLAPLPAQVGEFLADFDGTAPPAALYVLWFGGNDLRDAFALVRQEVQPFGPLALPDALQLAVDLILEPATASVRQALETLSEAGAHRFLVVHAPDISVLPALQGLPAEVRGIASGLTNAFNRNLRLTIADFESNDKAMRIVQFEVNGLLQAIFADPTRFGFENVTTPCLSFGTVDDPVCDRPKDSFFWDTLHPTRAAHRLIGDAAANCLAARWSSLECYNVPFPAVSSSGVSRYAPAPPAAVAGGAALWLDRL